MRRLLLTIAFAAAALSAAAQTEPPQALQADDSLYAGQAAVEAYQPPHRNPIYYFGSPFCEHFAEVRISLGVEDAALGFDYAYLPEVWGVHVSTMSGIYYDYVLAGADYRLSKPWHEVDWHLYGSAGAVWGDRGAYLRPALEVGARVAAAEQWGKFCFTSGTLGVLTTGDTWYMTFGFGLSISVLTMAGLLLGISG